MKKMKKELLKLNELSKKYNMQTLTCYCDCRCYSGKDYSSGIYASNYNMGRRVVMFTLVDYISRIMSMIMVVSKFIGLMMTSTKQSGEYDCRYSIEIDSG